MEQENDRSLKEVVSDSMTRKKAQTKKFWQDQKNNIWHWTKWIVLGAVAVVALFYLAVLISAWI